MRDAVIVSAARTPVGKAPTGTLRGTRPDELAATVTRPIFETYLAGTRGAAVEAGQLVVSVPSDFAAEWLGRKLAPLIQQCLTRTTGIAAGVILKADPEGSASARPMSSPQAAPFEHAP